MVDKPMLRIGDEGIWVRELQSDLNEQLPASLEEDEIFGALTEQAVIDYQRTRGLEVDGIVGPQTWDALDSAAPAIPLPPAMLSEQEQDDIREIARTSGISKYSWDDRGKGPIGYYEGMALAYAVTYLQLKDDVSWAVDMARANTHNADKDVLSWYAGFFEDADMDNSESGPDTMRHLWALMLGLGMRESSGRHCEGRDMSATNVQSDTCEAGLFQQSYNSSSATDEIDKLMAHFDRDNADCYMQTFAQAVSCTSSEWSCYGSGDGYRFQEMCKSCPTFCAQACAVGLRVIRQHWGPIGRYEVELKEGADHMFKAIETYLDRSRLPSAIA
jgi:hypothetical protein